MKFTIKGPVDAPVVQVDSYMVEMEMCHGDADHFSTFEVGPFARGEDELELALLLDLIQRMKDAYPNGRGGGESYSYSKVPGFDAWFRPWDQPDSVHKRAMEKIYEGRELDWPTDVTLQDCWDCHGEASPWKWKVVYYDLTGEKFNVDVSGTLPDDIQ